MLDFIFAIAHDVVLAVGYIGIALFLFTENYFPPLPSAFVLAYTGFLVSSGELSYGGIVLAGTLGGVIGAIPPYVFGRWADDRVLRRAVRRYGSRVGLDEAKYDRTAALFERYGAVLVVVGLMLPVIRGFVPLVAGAYQMPAPRFALFTTVGMALWCAAFPLLGWVLGDNWRLVQPYQNALLALVVVAVVLWWVWRRVRGRAQGRGVEAG